MSRNYKIWYMEYICKYRTVSNSWFRLLLAEIPNRENFIFKLSESAANCQNWNHQSTFFKYNTMQHCNIIPTI